MLQLKYFSEVYSQRFTAIMYMNYYYSIVYLSFQLLQNEIGVNRLMIEIVGDSYDEGMEHDINE